MNRARSAVVFIRLVAMLALCAVFVVLGVSRSQRASAQTGAAPPSSASAPAQDQSASVRPRPRTMSFGEAFFIQRSGHSGNIEIFGSMVIWFLLLLSVASIALISALAWGTRRLRILPVPIVTEVRRLLRAADFQGALERVERDDSFFSEIMASAIAEARGGHTAMLRALERASEERTTERLRRIETLNIIGAVSPMIGLFGTVYGIILAFREIVAAGGSPDPVGLAAGIGTALVTTFWGLITAIPALSAYALLRNILDSRTTEATLIAEDLINQLRPSASPAPNDSPPPPRRQQQPVA